MADNDKSITNLRYNQVTQGLEGFGGGSPMWTPLALVADGTKPAGLNTQIQYNNMGAFGADANLTWDGSGFAVGNGAISLFVDTSTFDLDWTDGGTNEVRAGSVPDFPSSILALSSLNKGFLPPRLTTSQRNAITSPAAGLQIYNTTTQQDEFYNGSVWNAVGGITQLTGDVTAGPGAGSVAASISSTTVTGKLLTGYVSGAGAVLASDTILQAIQKLNGNDALKLPLAGGTVTGATVFNVPVYQPNTSFAGTGTVSVDARTGYTFYTTVSGALIINGPNNATDGQKVTFRILNDASHSVTLATGAGNFRFGTDIPSYTNSVSKTDYIGAQYNQPAGVWDVISIIQGF